MVLPKERALEQLGQTPIAFIGTISQVIPGMSTRSFPPINHYRLKMENIQNVRGSIATNEFTYHQQGASFIVSQNIHNADGSDAAFAEGHLENNKEPVVGLICLACSSDGQHINILVELDNPTMDEVLKSTKVPLGWQKQSDGHYESAWQYSHAKRVKWYRNHRFDGTEKCSKSGRPLLITPGDIVITCEPIKPAQIHEYRNPDGDGVFQITVKNNSSQPVEVPALLRDLHSRNILWEESIFVITDAGNHFFPGHGQAHDVEPTILEPHESVSTRLDTLTLHGLTWPQGGWRLHLKFCLGDKATEGNYYYFTDHHDPLRKQSKKKKAAVVD